MALQNTETRQQGGVIALHKEVKELSKIGERISNTVTVLKSGGNIQREIMLPSPYFWQLVEKFESQMEETAHNLKQVETQLRPLRTEVSGPHVTTPHMLERILRAQHEAFMRIAGDVAVQHEKVIALFIL